MHSADAVIQRKIHSFKVYFYIPGSEPMAYMVLLADELLEIMTLKLCRQH